MSTQGNKMIARRYFEEIWNGRNLPTIDELVTVDAVGHVASMTIQGRTVLGERIATLHQIYSDPHFTVEDVIAEADRVAVRWILTGKHTGEFMSAAPSGLEVRVTGISIFRLVDGQIAELWVNSDDLGELQQLGVLVMSPVS